MDFFGFLFPTSLDLCVGALYQQAICCSVFLFSIIRSYFSRRVTILSFSLLSSITKFYLPYKYSRQLMRAAKYENFLNFTCRNRILCYNFAIKISILLLIHHIIFEFSIPLFIYWFLNLSMLK